MSIYEKTQRIYENAKGCLTTAAFLYVIGTSSYMTARPLTGHPSADIATGISQPTKLDKAIVKFLGGNIDAKQK